MVWEDQSAFGKTARCAVQAMSHFRKSLTHATHSPPEWPLAPGTLPAADIFRLLLASETSLIAAHCPNQPNAQEPRGASEMATKPLSQRA